MSPTLQAATVRLGIFGLTSLTDRMMRGGLYALVADTPPARYPIVAASLGSAIKNDIACTVILPTQPESFIERLGTLNQFDAYESAATGRLQFFVLQDDFAKTMFRFGAETFCRELDHFEIPNNSYLIFDQADDLLSLHDVSLAMDQVEILRCWFSEHKITGLLVFSRVASSSAAMATLQCLMDRLAGILHVGKDRAGGGLELTFDYWQSTEGTVAAKSYPIATMESGLYKITARESQSERGIDAQTAQAIDEGEDSETHFFFMDNDLIGLAKQMQGQWQHVDSLVGMMHATRGLASATVILTYRRDTDLRELAQAAHTLRMGLGRRARIVVQEKDASLRYQNEALLLRLGINMVIHFDVPPNRLPLVLESLGGQIFDRDVDINFEAALASVIPSGLRGYVLPPAFVREAELIIERSGTLNIPCSLVIGMPARDTTAADILSHLHMSRSGDLATFDNQYCYLFLSGCPETSLLMTLERVLGQAVDASFDESRFVVRRHEIAAEMAALARLAERGKLPDYLALPTRPIPIHQPAPAATAKPVAVATVAPVFTNNATPVDAMEAVPPRAAERAPLFSTGHASPDRDDGDVPPALPRLPKPLMPKRHEAEPSELSAPPVAARFPAAPVRHGAANPAPRADAPDVSNTSNALDDFPGLPRPPRANLLRPAPRAVAPAAPSARPALPPEQATPPAPMPELAPVFDQAMQAPPLAAPDDSGAAAEEQSRFVYGGAGLAKTSPFGKKEAPRATRAARKEP